MLRHFVIVFLLGGHLAGTAAAQGFALPVSVSDPVNANVRDLVMGQDDAAIDGLDALDRLAPFPAPGTFDARILNPAVALSDMIVDMRGPGTQILTYEVVYEVTENGYALLTFDPDVETYLHAIATNDPSPINPLRTVVDLTVLEDGELDTRLFPEFENGLFIQLSKDVALSIVAGSLRVLQDGPGVTFRWDIFSESDVLSYEVQGRPIESASSDLSWFRVDRVPASAPSSQQYSVHATTIGAGRYEFRVATLRASGIVSYSESVEAHVQPAGSGFAMSPAFPNPVTTASTIDVSVSREQRVLVEAFDIVGRRVATLFDGVVSPGATRFLLDHDFAPGWYLISARGQTARLTQSIVVTR